VTWRGGGGENHGGVKTSALRLARRALGDGAAPLRLWQRYIASTIAPGTPQHSYQQAKISGSPLAAGGTRGA